MMRLAGMGLRCQRGDNQAGRYLAVGASGSGQSHDLAFTAGEDVQARVRFRSAWLSVRHIRRQAAKTAEKGSTGGNRWRAMARVVQRRPITTLLVGVISLLALSAPALTMRLGFADSGNDPEATTSRQAYDLLAEGFGPGFNGPLIVLVKGDQTAGRTVQSELSRTDGVAEARRRVGRFPPMVHRCAAKV